MSTHEKRVAVLISGRGSNMEKLIEAAKRPGFPAKIALVLSDQADAAGLVSAAQEGIPTRVVARADFDSREAHEEAVGQALQAAKIEIVCLAGYMRLFTRQFVEKWLGRMINIHPALLPSFTGLDTHARALEAGVRVHGCTVHFVTFETDAGPIIAQAAVPVLIGDTPETLAARVLKAEHVLYPQAFDLVASGKARVADGRTVFSGIAEDGVQAAIVSPSMARDAPPDLESLARLTP